MSDERQQLLEDLRRQLPTIAYPGLREKTERAIRGLERELAGARGRALEKAAPNE